jgi:hypothetical protein
MTAGTPQVRMVELGRDAALKLLAEAPMALPCDPPGQPSPGGERRHSSARTPGAALRGRAALREVVASEAGDLEPVTRTG